MRNYQQPAGSTKGPAASRRAVFWSATILIVSALAVFGISLRGLPLVVATNLEKIPLQIAGYTATEDRFAPAVYEELDADVHVYRHYRSRGGEQIDLYIGYYGTAKGGRTGHNPYACLPGAGWAIIDSREALLEPDSRPGVRVNYILARKGNLYETIFHWYQSAGTQIASDGIQQNVYRFLGRILHNRNDGAFVRVSYLTEGEESLGEAYESAKTFAEEIIQLLPGYWPEEQEISETKST